MMVLDDRVSRAISVLANAIASECVAYDDYRLAYIYYTGKFQDELSQRWHTKNNALPTAKAIVKV